MPHILYVLKSIERQKGVNYEVIIVDRFSRDETIDVAKEFNAKIFQVKSERTYAVNFGARRAAGRYIYYLGSDYVLLGKNHLSNIVSQMDAKNADAGIITNLVDYRKGFWSRARFIEKLAYYLYPLIEAVRVFEKEAFIKIGGYRTDMVAYEEHELHYRMVRNSYKIIRIRGAIEVHIDEPKSLQDIIIKNFYYGSTSVSTFLKQSGSYAKRMVNPIRPSILYRFPWLIRADPIAAGIGLPIYQFSRYTAALIGIIGRRLKRKT